VKFIKCTPICVFCIEDQITQIPNVSDSKSVPEINIVSGEPYGDHYNALLASEENREK
jgi:hypothetical protein